MNTKQVEELTGITRQNIRYYERQGLLEPARETGNAYRDYSEEDVRRLKLIKMLRMLDMPLKEIESVLNEELPLKEAAARQQENLLKQQKQLQAAIDVCASIHKEKSEKIDVDDYLEKMENMSQNGGVFAQILDDYKQVASQERQRQFSFYAKGAVNTAGAFEAELQNYAKDHGMKFEMIEKGMYPEFTMDGVSYTAARVVEETRTLGSTVEAGEKVVTEATVSEKAAVRIVCKSESRSDAEREIPEGRRRFFSRIHTITVNIRRHRAKSILNVLVSLLIVVVMTVYMGNLNSARQQIKDLSESLPISGEVWNVCAEQNSGLFIAQWALDAVYQSAYVKEINEGVELIGFNDTGNVQETEDNIQSEAAYIPGKSYWLEGMNTPGCVKGFEEKEITWADGWNWKDFQEARNVCIVNQEVASGQNLQKGDVLSLSMQRYYQSASGTSIFIEELKPIQMQIVGTADFSELDPDIPKPDMLLPLDDVKQIFKENNKVYFASSLSFLVKDPMKLNELKKELKSAGFQSVVPGAEHSYAGAGLKIDDAVFIESMTSLEKSRALLEGFLPFVLLVVIMLGYIVPHLLLSGRREEYAIMRALGTSKREGGILFFTEHILLAALGSAAGMIGGMVFHVADAGTALMIWGLFLVCYALGAAVSMWMFGRFSVSAVLSHRD